MSNKMNKSKNPVKTLCFPKVPILVTCLSVANLDRQRYLCINTHVCVDEASATAEHYSKYSHEKQNDKSRSQPSQHRPPVGSGSVSNLDFKSCDHSLSFICSSPTSEENKLISFVRLFLAHLPKLNVAFGTCNIIRSHCVVNLYLAQQWRLLQSVTSLKTKALIWTLHILIWEQYTVGKQHYFLQEEV